MNNTITRYRITQDGREYWTDSEPDTIIALNGQFKVERVTTKLLQNVSWGCGKLVSTTELVIDNTH